MKWTNNNKKKNRSFIDKNKSDNTLVLHIYIYIHEYKSCIFVLNFAKKEEEEGLSFDNGRTKK